MSQNQYIQIQKELKRLGSKEKAKSSARFFKTGPGQYGEGDIFIGVSVPEQRKIARQFSAVLFLVLSQLLASAIHEERLTALLILVDQMKLAVQIGDIKKRKEIFDFYIQNLDRVNNWDLVDSSARDIVGSYAFDTDQNILQKLVLSKNLWHRRVSIIATHYFIQKGEYAISLGLAKVLFADTHDLTHKAVGWTIREIYKKDSKLVEDFLQKHIQKIPRTALRYAIERMPESKRKRYLRLK
ncbi:DNA alkylation repair protein [Patescibacteria group bacterium]|nr:MAG: DNA alkylation repair protein [Patescibacteria group bacterium]